MVIILDSEDLASLPAKIRELILSLPNRSGTLGENSLKSPTSGSVGSKPAKASPGVRSKIQLHSLTPAHAKDLLVNVNPTAAAVLRQIAVAGSPFDWKAVKAKGYASNRFLGAIHRRLGTLTKGSYNAVATVEGDDERSVLVFSPATIASLRKAVG